MSATPRWRSISIAPFSLPDLVSKQARLPRVRAYITETDRSVSLHRQVCLVLASFGDRGRDTTGGNRHRWPGAPTGGGVRTVLPVRGARGRDRRGDRARGSREGDALPP